MWKCVKYIQEIRRDYLYAIISGISIGKGKNFQELHLKVNKVEARIALIC